MHIWMVARFEPEPVWQHTWCCTFETSTGAQKTCWPLYSGFSTLNFKLGSFWRIWSRFNSCICDPLNCTKLRLYHVFLWLLHEEEKRAHVIQLGYFMLKNCQLVSVPSPARSDNNLFFFFFLKNDWIDALSTVISLSPSSCLFLGWWEQ